MRLFVTFGNKIIGRERNLSVLNYGVVGKDRLTSSPGLFPFCFFKGKPGDEVEESHFKIEVFRHLPRTANVKKSRDPEVSDLPQGFSHYKTPQPRVWEKILLFRTLLLINYWTIFHRNVALKAISQLKLKWKNEWINQSINQSFILTRYVKQLKNSSKIRTWIKQTWQPRATTANLNS